MKISQNKVNLYSKCKIPTHIRRCLTAVMVILCCFPSVPILVIFVAFVLPLGVSSLLLCDLAAALAL